MYRERASRIDGAAVWTRTATGAHRVVPDGCMDLIWDGACVFVAGPDTRAHVAPGGPATRFTGLRFAPGTGAPMLGVPAYVLRDQRVALEAVWGTTEAGGLAERLACDPAPGRVLEAAAAEHQGDGDPDAEALTTVVHGLRAGTSVAAVAEAIGLSQRQLHRRSLDAFGYGPKFLARVLRMNRALELARADVAFAETAARAGYADQAHLAREIRALTGVSLGQLIV